MSQLDEWSVSVPVLVVLVYAPHSTRYHLAAHQMVQVYTGVPNRVKMLRGDKLKVKDKIKYL